MRNSAGLALSLLLAAGPAVAAETRSILFEADPYAGDELAGAVSRAFRPAYRLAEGVSDGFYGMLRSHLLGGIFPGRLSRGLGPAPAQGSASLFERNLQEKEARYFQRLREAYPTAPEGRADPARLTEWRAWAAEEQTGVVVDALRDTLTERYQLKLWGRRAGTYAKDRRNWDPASLTAAGLVGGGFLYLNGMHSSGTVGRMRVAVDLRSGLRLQQALQSGGDARHMAGLEVGYKRRPVTLAAEWGVRGGRMRGEQLGLKYRLRY